MKLIYCSNCHDMVLLSHELRSCKCGRQSGMYLEDGMNVEISKGAMPIGIANKDIDDAYFRYQHNFKTTAIRCWSLEPGHPSVKVVDKVSNVEKKYPIPPPPRMPVLATRPMREDFNLFSAKEVRKMNKEAKKVNEV